METAKFNTIPPSDFVKSEELTYKYYIKHKIKSYNRRSGLLKTIEKKKKQLEEFSSEKTKAKKPNTNSDQNQAQFHINKQSEKSPEKLKRSIVRGKLLYENAMEAVEKKKLRKAEVLEFRKKNEFNGCSFSPQITNKASNLKDYENIVQKTKKNLEKIEKKRKERQEQLKEKELENCTFSPSILRYNKEQSTISPERQRLNKLAKFEFGKNKSIWRKEFNIEDGQPKNPRFEVTAKDLHDDKKKKKIIEKILSPRKNNNIKYHPSLDFKNERKTKCEFCKQIHEIAGKDKNETIKCFLGYYGLTKSFVHKDLYNTPPKNHLNHSIQERIKKYPKFDEYLSKSFIKEKEIDSSNLYRKVAETFQIFENFHSKSAELRNLSYNLYNIKQKKPIISQENSQDNYNEKNIHLKKMEEDYTYSDEKMIPFTKIKDLKYQKSKPFKAVSILNNQYIFETSTKLSTDETKNSIKNSNDVYTYHKTDLEKIDSPYNIMKKKKEEKNLKHNQPKEMQITGLERSFIRNYQKQKIVSDLKKKYHEVLKKN